MFSKNGDQLLSAGEDGTVKFWDVKNKRVIHTFSLEKEKIEGDEFNALMNKNATEIIKIAKYFIIVLLVLG